uniref:PORR domain-containing protein n=1 Tax=Vitis vinifera TaxID=29760 RepID=A5AHL3_VITVI|nr:hypothetical protein VITISV_022340 [Vitis vinifera]
MDKGIGVREICTLAVRPFVSMKSLCTMFLGLHQSLESCHSKNGVFALMGRNSVQRLGSVWVQIMHISSGGRRPKKKIYHRVHELDRVMDLKKKPCLILQLKSIIQSQKHQSLLLRDLEKQVGFVHKWNFMAVIEKYPSIFRVNGGNRTPPSVELTEKAKRIADEETEARKQMEPILVENLRKLLMMSVDCRVPLENIEFIESELGLPQDFKETLIPKYPEFFSVKDFQWEGLSSIGKLGFFAGSHCPREKARVSKDGNFSGPYAFLMSYPAGFRPNMSYLEEVQRWQKMEFPSPYLNARRFEAADPKARKRVVAVLHELLSLTMEKRMTSAQLDAFHSEFLLPARLLLCLIKHHVVDGHKEMDIDIAHNVQLCE